MKSGAQSSFAEIPVGKLPADLVLRFNGTLVMALFAVLAVALALLAFPRSSTEENVTTRCDSQALTTVGPAQQYRGDQKQWRRERLAAFQRCMDQALQPTSQPEPQMLAKTVPAH